MVVSLSTSFFNSHLSTSVQVKTENDGRSSAVFVAAGCEFVCFE